MKIEVEYTIIQDSPDSAAIILEDGSISSYYHNGEHFIVEYYQDRLTPDMLDCEDIPWAKLAEGKMYLYDLAEGEGVGDPMIQAMLGWMYIVPYAEVSFIRKNIDWSNIKTLIKQ